MITNAERRRAAIVRSESRMVTPRAVRGDLEEDFPGRIRRYLDDWERYHPEEPRPGPVRVAKSLWIPVGIVIEEMRRAR